MINGLDERLKALPMVMNIYCSSEIKTHEKNIAIFMHTLAEGGSQRAVERLLEKLVIHDIGIYIFSPTDGKYARIYTEKYETKVVIIDYAKSLFGSDRDVMLCFDAVIINSMCSIRYLLYYLNTVIPCFVWIHEGEEVINHWLNQIDPIILGSANFIFGFPWLKPMELWKEKFSETVTYFLPIEVQEVTKTKLRYGSKETTRFLIPGSYSQHKGFHLALQAFMLMENACLSDFSAVFCGYDNESEYYRILKEKGSNYDNLEFLGELSEEELSEQMELADCIIIPSIIDAGPLTAVETLAHQKLLIISDATGVSGYLQDCYNGFVFSNESIEELYKRILLVYHDKEKLSSIAERGRLVYEQYYTYDAMDAAVTELLKRLLIL